MGLLFVLYVYYSDYRGDLVRWRAGEQVCVRSESTV